MTHDEQFLLKEKYRGRATREFEADRHRLASGEPVAYVIGWQPFLGLKIYLDSRPLIPRPETEWWAEQMFRTIAKGAEHLRFLDLCAGSGAIGCAVLARFPQAKVSFGEIDPAHEATIRKNIAVNNLNASHAKIRIGDLFEPFSGEQFDFVAANPPYVPDARELPESVARYEPALALRAGADGLALIRRIASGLPQHLMKGGQAWIECDSAHSGEARGLFEAAGFDVQVSVDQFALPRLLVVEWPHD
ncbi:peptide chain release factor N(5)-glutamine methyltransferase [Candidatus Kaiserbacteria bacterium]|nr:peptide chain release factor N(5)-glutamine methyltransferase [Candidatus Kaiserbacteria bacterium]